MIVKNQCQNRHNSYESHFARGFHSSDIKGVIPVAVLTAHPASIQIPLHNTPVLKVNDEGQV